MRAPIAYYLQQNKPYPKNR